MHRCLPQCLHTGVQSGQQSRGGQSPARQIPTFELAPLPHRLPNKTLHVAKATAFGSAGR